MTFLPEGLFAIEEFTDLVKQAVLEEFVHLSRRGCVLGAMEVQYQRHKIQEQSLYYEKCKHDGTLPVISVNTFIKDTNENNQTRIHLIRSSGKEKINK